MHALAHFLAWLWHLVAWWWSDQPTGTPEHPLQAGFIIAIIGAIISIALQIGQYVLDAGVLIFNTLTDAVKFAARGVVWLTGIVRNAFVDLLDHLKDFSNAIEKWVYSAYCTFRDLIGKIESFLQPMIDFVNKIRKWFDLVWKNVVRPVLNLLQRIRKVLAIFKFFHLKWAEKLDQDLAWLEGKITKAFLVVRQWVNLLTSWVNFLVDPNGIIRAFPMVAGFWSALNVTWSGIFGTPFQGAGGAGNRPGNSTSVTVSFPATLQDVQNGTGGAGQVQQNFAIRQTAWDTAAGLK
jgi:hypothetical protein